MAKTFMLLFSLISAMQILSDTASKLIFVFSRTRIPTPFHDQNDKNTFFLSGEATQTAGRHFQRSTILY